MHFSGQVWGVPVRVVVKIIQQTSIKNHEQIYHQVDFMCNVNIALFCGSFIWMGRSFCVWVKGHLIFQQPPQNLLKNVAQMLVNMKPQMPTCNPWWALFKHLLSFPVDPSWQLLWHGLAERKYPQATHIVRSPAQICTVWIPSCHLAPVSTHLIHSDSCHANMVLASTKAERQGKSEATRTVGECVCGYVLYIPAIFSMQWVQKGIRKVSDPHFKIQNESTCVELNWLNLILKPGRVDMEDSCEKKHMNSKMRF